MKKMDNTSLRNNKRKDNLIARKQDKSPEKTIRGTRGAYRGISSSSKRQDEESETTGSSERLDRKKFMPQTKGYGLGKRPDFSLKSRNVHLTSSRYGQMQSALHGHQLPQSPHLDSTVLTPPKEKTVHGKEKTFKVVVGGEGVLKPPGLGPRPYNALAIIHTAPNNTFDMLNSLTTSVEWYSLTRAVCRAQRLRFRTRRTIRVSSSNDFSVCAESDTPPKPNRLKFFTILVGMVLMFTSV